MHTFSKVKVSHKGDRFAYTKQQKGRKQGPYLNNQICELDFGKITV